MMNKKDHINYWLRTGHQSWEAGILLMHGNKNVEALFMFCLAIEKYVKANWVNDNIIMSLVFMTSISVLSDRYRTGAGIN